MGKPGRPKKFDLKKITLFYVIQAIREIRKEGQKYFIMEKGDLLNRWGLYPYAIEAVLRALKQLGFEDRGQVLIVYPESLYRIEAAVKNTMGIPPETLEKLAFGGESVERALSE